MEELSPREKQQQVNDLIGEWMDKNNIYFLAKEGELVYWDSITGLPQDFCWQTMTVPEASRYAKVMFIPPALMSYCTNDAVYTAAQECGRAYLQGVRSKKPVKEMYFNFVEHESVIKCPYYEVVYDLINALFEKKFSPEWQLMKSILGSVFHALDMEPKSERIQNDLMRSAAREVGYRVSHGKTAYSYKHPEYGIKKWACLRYPNTSGIIVDLPYGMAQELTSYVVGLANKRNKRFE